MANGDHYSSEYRLFFEKFAKSVVLNDQLPVRLGSYKFLNSEVVGGIVDWCLQYLKSKRCPLTLMSPLVKITIDEIRQTCKKHPVACGFIPHESVYEPLKLMQTVIAKLNEICLRYLDNSQLDTLLVPSVVSVPQVGSFETRNVRKRMEDKYIVIHDLDTMFNVQDSSASSYYAVFDGHAGQGAAWYSAAHLHQFLVESQYYPTDPENAFKEAFLRTDEFYLQKSDNSNSGTTAVCALYRPKQSMLYVAWVGDSQALMVSAENQIQIVKPHIPNREDEAERIKANGGFVMYCGKTWRVNGHLAVSRAIGDKNLKPFVSPHPEVIAISLDGTEDFLVLACDGLWDVLDDKTVAKFVYDHIRAYQNAENVNARDFIQFIARQLVIFAKRELSRDNITVIIVFLKEISSIVLGPEKNILDDIDFGLETDIDDPFNNNPSPEQMELERLQTSEFDRKERRADRDETPTPPADSELFAEPVFTSWDQISGDLGPETDVDGPDEPSNNNPSPEQMELEMHLQRLQTSEFDLKERAADRDETPTPPADSVLDNSVLTDNVAESGDDSEDEWNFYRVDPKQIAVEVQPEEPESDEMSQLNPDAAEFVPVSPTRNVASPIYNRDIMDDMVLAQSPRRAVPMDIDVPSPNDFQCEVKQRPSDVMGDFTSSNDNQNRCKLTSQKIMENLLNGKNVSDIEFHPSSYNKSPIQTNPFDQDFGIAEQNIETKQDEPDFTNNDFKTEQDPMSMSYYQDKDEDGFGTDPFDLNQIQQLPDGVSNLDEDPKELDNTLPESPLQELSTVAENVMESSVPDIMDNVMVTVGNDNYDLLMEHKSPLPDMHSPSIDLTSPVGPLSPKSPMPELQDLVSPDITASIKDENISCDFDSRSPVPNQTSPMDDVLQSPENFCESKSPLLLEVHQIPEIGNSPLGCESISPAPEQNVKTTNSLLQANDEQQYLEDVSDFVSEAGRSLRDNFNDLVEHSTDLIEEINKEAVNKYEEYTDFHQDGAVMQQKSDICDLQEEIQEITNIVENVSDIHTEAKEDLNKIEQSIEELNLTDKLIINDEPDQITNVNLETKDFVKLIVDKESVMEGMEDIPESLEDIKDMVEIMEKDMVEVIEKDMAEVIEVMKDTECFNVPVMSKELVNMQNDVEKDILEATNDVDDISNEVPKFENIVDSINEMSEEAEILLESAELSATKSDMIEQLNASNTDSFPSVNSFLERSEVPDITSPLSPTDLKEPSQLWRETEIKCETISPEYAMHIITSPSEESAAEPIAVMNLEPEPEPEMQITEVTEKLTDIPEASVEPEVAAGIAAGISAVGIAAGVVAETMLSSSPKSKSPIKKSSVKVSPVSPTKPPATKAPIKKTAPVTTASKTTSKTTTLKPKTTTPTPSPRMTRTTPTAKPKPTASPSTKPLEKKMLNGDVKAPVRQPPPIRRPTSGSTTTTKPPMPSVKQLSPTAPKTLGSKTVTNGTSKPLTNGITKTTTNRPTTAPSKTTTSAPPKPRPNSLTSKTTSSTTSTVLKSSTTTKSAALATSKSVPNTSTTMKPKMSMTSKPKSMLTVTKTTSKAPDTEKQIKESANKQLSATRTSTVTRNNITNRTTTSTFKKADTKAPLKSTTKTTTTTLRSVNGKKPTEVTRTTITKSKGAPAKLPTNQNEIVSVVQQITTVSVVSEEPQLVKDNSPVEISPVDNSQLLESALVAD